MVSGLSFSSDDILLVARSFQECVEELASLRKLLESLGFLRLMMPRLSLGLLQGFVSLVLLLIQFP